MRGTKWMAVVAALGLTALGVAHGPLFSVLGAPMAAPATTSHVVLDLGGSNAGAVKDLSGGDPLAGGQFSDISFHAALPVPAGAPFGQWIWGATNGQSTTRDGRFAMVDYQGRITDALEFRGARIREVTFDALDAASREPGRVTVKLSPQTAAHQTYNPPSAAPSGWNVSQKVWLSSNFRVAIEGLPCNRVSKVASFSLVPAAPPPGTVKGLALASPKVEAFSVKATSIATDITLTVAMADYTAFQTWATSVLTQGHSTDTKNGTIQLLDASLQQTVQTISFTGLIVTAIHTNTVSGSGDQIQRFTITMHAPKVSIQ